MRRFAAIVALCLTLPVFATVVAIPKLTGRVVDRAGAFTSEEALRIERALADLENRRGVQMAVLAVPTIGDEAIEAFSLRVVEAWKLGKKGDDKGLLFVFAPAERKMRLEVGYGLEGTLPDAVAKRILSDRVRPYFRDQNFSGGTLTAIDAVEARLAREGSAENPPSVGSLPEWQPRSYEAPFGMGLLLFFLIFVGFAASILGAGRRRRWYDSSGWGSSGGSSWGSSSGSSWGGSSGSGGGFSGGGGGFGGGGASSDW